MARKRKKEITPHKLQEILRLGLKHQLGYREISRSCAVSHVTVRAYLKQVKDVGITWDEVESLEESRLRELVRGAHRIETNHSRPEPDWQQIHKELKRKGVTIQLLWEEYKEQNHDGYQSTQFYELYRKWKSTISPWMRQNHKTGDKLFVDYAGQTIPIQSQKTGEIHQVQIFVAVLGMSNYTFAEATWDQTIQSWVSDRMSIPLSILGAFPACWYRTILNRRYQNQTAMIRILIPPIMKWHRITERQSCRLV